LAIVDRHDAHDYVTVLKGDTVEMSKQISNKHLDLCFIDADHTYKGCKRDIQAYLPKIKKGGIMAGDDMDNAKSFYSYLINLSIYYEEELQRKRDWFYKKTDNVFGSEFKGFEFTLDDKKVTYSPGDATELKKAQSDPNNFIGKFLNEDGLIEDAVGYHKALSIAMNPDKFAKFFYEQGKAEATDDVMRKTKNINMSERKTPEVTSKGGMQIKSLGNDSGRGLKIRSKK